MWEIVFKEKNKKSLMHRCVCEGGTLKLKFFTWYSWVLFLLFKLGPRGWTEKGKNNTKPGGGVQYMCAIFRLTQFGETGKMAENAISPSPAVLHTHPRSACTLWGSSSTGGVNLSLSPADSKR